MENKTLKETIKQQFEEQRKIGYELGYVMGMEEGTEKAYRTVQCELLSRKLLTEEQVMELFALSEEEIKKLKEFMNNPLWLRAHFDWNCERYGCIK